MVGGVLEQVNFFSKESKSKKKTFFFFCGGWGGVDGWTDEQAQTNICPFNFF